MRKPGAGEFGGGSAEVGDVLVVTNAEGTNAVVIGFNRVETPLVEMRAAAVATNREAFSFNGAMDPLATATNRVVEPMTQVIRFVHFRYFDGGEWRESWDGVDLPLGVEVTLGSEPATPEDEEYSAEVFQRLIYVPGGRASGYWEDFP